MQRIAGYPFCGIVGQEDMKLALVLNVINPSLGGVLIKGEKGSAKQKSDESNPASRKNLRDLICLQNGTVHYV